MDLQNIEKFYEKLNSLISFSIRIT